VASAGSALAEDAVDDAGLLTACAISAGPAPAQGDPPSYSVEIAADVSPRMQPKDVAQVVATRTARPIRGVGPGGVKLFSEVHRAPDESAPGARKK
jgi:hypothetical protein